LSVNVVSCDAVDRSFALNRTIHAHHTKKGLGASNLVKNARPGDFPPHICGGSCQLVNFQKTTAGSWRRVDRQAVAASSPTLPRFAATLGPNHHFNNSTAKRLRHGCEEGRNRFAVEMAHLRGPRRDAFERVHLDTCRRQPAGELRWPPLVTTHASWLTSRELEP